MSAVRIDRRGLPDGNGYTDCPYDAAWPGPALFSGPTFGLVDGEWVPWAQLEEQLGSCACGGTGRVGPDFHMETGEWSQRGSLEPCPHCPNGATQAAHYRRLGHRTWSGMKKWRLPHPHAT